MRAWRVLAVGVVVFGLWAQPAAHAADPASGSITKSKRSVSWSGGPIYLSQPNPVASDCLGGSSDPTCDYYALTVTLGEGAKVQVKVTTARPNTDDGVNGVQGDDYDLFIYAPNGALVAEGANPRGNETAEFRHRKQYNGKPYEVRITPWLVLPGSTYKGTAKALTLGR